MLPEPNQEASTPSVPKAGASKAGASKQLGVPRLGGALAYGGDYNPEQWPEAVWHEDVALMREAGVNLVTVGVFSWALLEPAEGRFDFGLLDRVLDLLHRNGILVDLATPTAAPPPWFARAYPHARPVDRDGRLLGGGSRQTYCPSAPEYAAASARIAEQLARRYADHPALALWHVNNEYGCHNAHCYCEVSVSAFRAWLRARHGDLASLNEAWGTAFWSQRYGAWEEIDAPRPSTAAVNPALQLDFFRFCSDAHLANFRRERDILHRLSPGVPVTTNFLPVPKPMDYWRWAGEVDLVALDHYLAAESPDNHIDLAMVADLARSLAGGAPWLLMEHSTSAVNWQPRNIAKRPGELRRNSLAHVARGSDGAMFFQWRASRRGAEKFHSAMVPHGGPDTRIHREVVSLGAELGRLAEVSGTRVTADVAVVWDWESWWALELDNRPSVDLNYLERISAYYDRLWRAGLTVDFLPAGARPRGYRLVVVPSLYLTTPAAAHALTGYVEDGGVLVVSYFSGIVDADDAVYPGMYPGALRDLLGLSIGEFLPLRENERVRLAECPCGADTPATDGPGASVTGNAGVAVSDGAGVAVTGDVWAEEVRLAGAEAILRYVDGPAAGGPAVTRHRRGRGVAWYVSTRLTGDDLDTVLRRSFHDAGLRARESAAEGLEIVRREGTGDASYLFAINHGRRDVTLERTGRELLTGVECPEELSVPAGEVRVLRQHQPGG